MTEYIDLLTGQLHDNVLEDVDIEKLKETKGHAHFIELKNSFSHDHNTEILSEDREFMYYAELAQSGSKYFWKYAELFTGSKNCIIDIPDDLLEQVVVNATLNRLS